MERPRHLIRHDERADGHAARKPLGKSHDIGLHAEMLVSEHLARAPHAALNLIEDQECAVLVAKLAHALQVFCRRHMDAALALNRFEQDGARLRAHHLFQLFDIAVMHIVESRRQGTEAFVILRLPRRRQCRERASVKTVPRRDDLRLFRIFRVRILVRDLDCTLVRFRARVGEKRLAESRKAHEPFRCIRLRLRVIEIRAVDHAPRLFGDRLDERRIGVTKHVDRDAREEVDVLPAVVVENVDALAVIEHDLVAVEHGQIARRVLRVDCFICFSHNFPRFSMRRHFTTCVPMPAEVKISKMMEWPSLPSMICVFAAPASSALRHASTFGIMPPVKVPSSI